MKFWITIIVNSWKKNKYLVEHTLVNLREERFKVIEGMDTSLSPVTGLSTGIRE